MRSNDIPRTLLIAACLTLAIGACRSAEAPATGGDPLAGDPAVLPPTATVAAETDLAEPPGEPAGDEAAIQLAGGAPIAEGTTLLDAETLVGEKNFLTGYRPKNPDGTVNAVVEIPAGYVSKWEVTDDDGNMHWDIEDGKPRMVAYLGYPVNYGMVPQTVLSEAMGGDGDPLDVLVLGEAIPRGTVLPVRVIAIVKLTDGGERDDKLVAVREGTAFSDLSDLGELEAQFGGVTGIVETWFMNYKGPGVFETQGWGGAGEAMATLDQAIEAYGSAAPGAGATAGP